MRTTRLHGVVVHYTVGMVYIKHKKTGLRKLVTAIITLGVIFGGAYLYETQLRMTATTPRQLSTSKPTDLPSRVVDDKTPAEKQRYSVPPTHPRQLVIESLGVNANILAVGLTADGAMDAPATAWDTGWYNQSSLPGAGTGALLIDGHVNNTIGTPGVFFKIDTLKAGDTMQVERGDGQVFTYSVAAVEQKKIEDVDMAKMMRSITPGKQGLNLITCGGEYDSRRKTFDDRILVYAHQIE